MENNKLFKENISENLYNDVLEHFQKMHVKHQAIQDLDNTVQKKAKVHKAVMYTGGLAGLVTIGAAIANGLELTTVSQSVLSLSAAGSFAIGVVSTKMHKAIESLREDYRNRLTGPMTDLGTFYRFEEKLVMDLNKAGIPVYLQGVTDYKDFKEMQDLWKTSKNPDEDLKAKTAEYVKNMIEEYSQPEAQKPIKFKPY